MHPSLPKKWYRELLPTSYCLLQACMATPPVQVNSPAELGASPHSYKEMDSSSPPSKQNCRSKPHNHQRLHFHVQILPIVYHPLAMLYDLALAESKKPEGLISSWGISFHLRRYGNSNRLRGGPTVSDSLGEKSMVFHQNGQNFDEKPKIWVKTPVQHT
jgi:hypothetical protein